MRNVLRKMRALLREPQRGAVGVSLTDGGICLACLAGTEEFQRREETLHLPLPPTEAKESLWQEAAGIIQVALAKRGWEKSRIAVCLTEDEVFSYSREFPPLSEREMREAARWDLLASLPDVREEAAYSLDFRRVGEREVVLAALPREKVREIHRAFSHAGLCLASLCFLPTGRGWGCFSGGAGTSFAREKSLGTAARVDASGGLGVRQAGRPACGHFLLLHGVDLWLERLAHP